MKVSLKEQKKKKGNITAKILKKKHHTSTFLCIVRGIEGAAIFGYELLGQQV